MDLKQFAINLSRDSYIPILQDIQNIDGLNIHVMQLSKFRLKYRIFL